MRHTLISTAAFLALDQLTKYFVLVGLNLDRLGYIEVFPPFLNFHLTWNRGINFGLFASDSELVRWGLVGLAAGVSVFILAWVRRRSPSPLICVLAGMLAGGALGNAVDRAFHGEVMDFLNVSCCGIVNPFAFNVADVAVFSGAIGLVILSGRVENRT